MITSLQKIILIVTLALLGLSNFSRAQWNLLLPPPSFATYYSLSFPTKDTGYAVGSGGTIIKTTDAGGTWSVKTSGTTKDLLSVSFTDASTGYAVGFKSGGNVIIKTSDGGIPGRNKPAE